MSMEDDFIDRLEKHEEEGHLLPDADQKWFAGLKAALMARGELRLKKRLDTYYAQHQEEKKKRAKRITWMSIAASLLIGTFVVYNAQVENQSNPVNLQSENPPVLSDSATFDSIKNQIHPQKEVDSVGK